VEIITGVERRRRWRVDEKLRILAELERPGACFAEVARRHDVSRGLLWNWRRPARSGTLGPARDVQFLPVQVMPEAAAAEQPRPVTAPPSRRSPAAADAMIEIALPDGTSVRVGRDASAGALRRVLGVLRG
jgi:transposase